MSIEELELEEKRILSELDTVQQMIRLAREEAAGCRTGDLVVSKSLVRAGEVFRVSKVDFDFDPPWVTGQKRRPDGSFTDMEYNLYDLWEPTP